MHHVERAAAHVLPRSGKRAHGRTSVRQVSDGLSAIIAKDASDFGDHNPRFMPLSNGFPVLDFFLQGDRSFFLHDRWRLTEAGRHRPPGNRHAAGILTGAIDSRAPVYPSAAHLRASPSWIFNIAMQHRNGTHVVAGRTIRGR
ncbi:hypothetical protein [Pandoraea faecigallinarum]|uniref:hypothetical protein n=1 Tax=Pandoraea faecigallinarum TaxID=656179 RepID=UPI001428D43E|nr:hypothetical protein [Pandoraea faecigallinarum]